MASINNKNSEKVSDVTLEVVKKIVSEIEYGSITLIIQDGVIVQIDRNEKIRIK